jgi:hypothetical protein
MRRKIQGLLLDVLASEPRQKASFLRDIAALLNPRDKHNI